MTFRQISWTAVLFLTTASAAAAQEVTIDAPGASDRLMSLLEDASLSLSLDDEEDPQAQDYVAAARADYRRLLAALYAAGYYSGTISIRVNGAEAANIAPLAAPDRVETIAINVDPGPLFAFGRAEVTPLAPDTDLPDGFAPGEDAEAEVIRQAATAARTAWRDAGYAKVEVAGQQIVARHADNLLDATVTLAPGPQLTFGPLKVTGNVDVRTSAILRIAGLPTGEVFSPEELTQVTRRLRETGAFDSVTLTEAEAIGPGDTLPIEAAIVESKPRRIGAGVEYSTVEGIRLSTYWMHRNFFGGAENLRVDAQVAGIGGGTGGMDYTLSTALKIPAIYGADTDLTATAQISRMDEPDYLIDSASTEVLVSRLINNDLEVEGGFGLLTAREEGPLGNRNYTLLTAPLSAAYDKRDVETNAKRGYYIKATATPFLSIAGGSSGARAYLDGRGYYSFGADDRFTLAARGQVGTLVGADETDAPADFLFYSGGSGTVRGEGYKSLGIDRVVDGETVTTGGTSYAGVQVEARVGITDSIGLVGFYDYGYVGSTPTPLTDGADQSGVGIGVRYNTGIGPIRLDVGTPASGEDQFESVEVYIGIGQAF
ncbi:autotransporter assembly complex protein TamA [Loktanella sp. DJP18]|uniref:autotransporter assembly complex protein TamA n=1 Tax=Loktanella sp. DJP18 TaxID=3409788 RepID=UPI003BB56995